MTSVSHLIVRLDEVGYSPAKNGKTGCTFTREKY
jgi:hypothetical protein